MYNNQRDSQYSPDLLKWNIKTTMNINKKIVLAKKGKTVLISVILFIILSLFIFKLISSTEIIHTNYVDHNQFNGRDGVSGSLTGPKTNQSLLWKFNLSNNFNEYDWFAGPSIVDGFVYIAEKNSSTNFYKLYANNGSIACSYPLGETDGTPAIYNGVAYLTTFNWTENLSMSRWIGLVAINTSDCTNIWNSSKSLSFVGSVALNTHDGIVYAKSFGIRNTIVNASLYAFNITNGNYLWNNTAPCSSSSTFASSPTYANGSVYWASCETNGGIYSLNSSTGIMQWGLSSFNLTGSTDMGVWDSSPVVYEDSIYQGIYNNIAYTSPAFMRLNKTNGNPIKNYSSQYDSVFVTPVIHNDILWFVDYAGYGEVYYINGSRIYEDAANFNTGPFYSSPVVADGVVYFNDGPYIIAFNETNPASTILFRYQTGGTIYSQLAVADGVLFFVSDDGYLYALGNYSYDITNPTISIASPLNQTYRDNYNYSLRLNVSASDLNGISSYWYSLNGGEDTTFTPNITLTGLVAGSNNITVWVNDSANNVNSSNVTFYLSFTPKINNINISNSTTSYSLDGLNSGLVGWWKLDKNYTIQEDSSGNGNNGTVNGAIFTNNGRIGGAYSFDGINDNINMGDILKVGGNRTILAWFYLNDTNHDQAIITKEGATGDGEWILWFDDLVGVDGNSPDKLSYVYINSGGASVSAWAHSSTLVANKWYFVSVVHEWGKNITISINGVEDTPFRQFVTSTTSATSTASVKIGQGSGTSRSLNGTGDEVRVYNRILSQDEINYILSITNPTFQEYANVTINSTITDEDTPQGSLWYEWVLNGVRSLWGLAKNVFSFFAPSQENIVVLTVNDSNNYSVTQTWNITTIFINPTINFTSPTPDSGDIIKSDSFVVNFTGTEVNLQSGWVEFNNTNHTATCSGTDHYYCYYNFAESDGFYNYTAWINDSVGNNNHTETRLITLDAMPPVITFIEPPTPTNGSNVGYSNVTILANVSDASGLNSSTWIDFDNSLVGYWEFDWYNSSGIYDNSSYSNFMRFNNGLNTSNVIPGAVVGNGYYFNGSASYLSSIKSVPIANYSDFSVSYWENLSRQDKDGHTPMSVGWSYGDGIGFGIRPGTTGSYGIYFGNSFYTFGYNYRNGDLYQNVMITITHDNKLGITKLYRNGVLNSTLNTRRIRFGFTNPSVLIGAEGVNYRSSNGTYDHFMLFNKVISANEVGSIYNSQINLLNTTFSNLSNIQHNYTVYTIDVSSNFNTSGKRNFITNASYNLTITYPTTIFPAYTNSFGNLSVNFNFLDYLYNITDTSVIVVNDIYIDGNRTTILNKSYQILFRINDTGTTASANPVTVTFPALTYTNYTPLLTPFIGTGDLAYSYEVTSRAVGSLGIRTKSMNNSNLAETFMYGAIPYGYYNINGKIIQCNKMDIAGQTSTHQFYTPMLDSNYSMALSSPSTSTCAPITSVNGYSMSRTSFNERLDNSSGSSCPTMALYYCAFTRGEYNTSNVYIKAGNQTQVSGLVTVNFTSNFSNTNYAVFLTHVKKNAPRSCRCAVINRNVDSFTASCQWANLTSTCNNDAVDWVAITNGNFNETYVSQYQQVSYSIATGFQVNISLPNITQGKKDLFMNLTYLGLVFNSTQVDSIYNRFPNVSIIVPINNTFTNNQTVNFTANLSDIDSGVSNATLNVYNSSGNIYYTNTTIFSNQTSITWEVITNFIDDIYTWFINLFDAGGNNYQTANQTLTIDTVIPTITFIEPPTPSDGATLNFSSIANIVANISNNITLTSSWIDFDRSIIGYWEGDWYNSSGVYDNSTYNRFGTFSGGMNTADITSGIRGKAILFDGKNARDSINAGTIKIPSNGSISFWINANKGLTYQRAENIYPVGWQGKLSILGPATGTTERAGIITSNGTDRYYDWGNQGFYDGNWHHYFVTWDGTYIYLFKDGIQVGTPKAHVNEFVTLTTGTFKLGAGWNDGYGTHSGLLDEVIISNRTSYPSEVLALYNSQANLLNASFTNLSYGWHNYSVSAVDGAGNYNVTNLRSIFITTCNYFSGNWQVNCADNCELNSNVNGGLNNFSVIGPGTFTLNANITNFKNYLIAGGCTVTCKNGCINYQ